MIGKIKAWFESLDANKKRLVALSLFGVCCLTVLLTAYNAKTKNAKPTAPIEKPSKTRNIDFASEDDDMALRIGMRNQLNESERKKNEELKKQQSEIDELKKTLEQLGKEPLQSGGSYGDLLLDGVPPVPGGSGDPVPAAPVQPPIVIMGGISAVSVSAPSVPAPADNTTKKKRLINYIPAGSIMKATLLNGMYAPTMGKGESKPYPALFRVWDLSFLPNGVRKDLSGCFVTGEAYGELSDSRVHVRLSKLSCISDDRTAVLEKSIKGFVNGDDGKVGLFGEIRANFGKLALSALLAEFLSAAGDTIKSATRIETLNPLGGITTTTKPNVGDIALSAAGSGIGESASMIADFYLDIMKEMSPVIEISGRRDVELIFDTGLELLTDDFKWEGVKENEIDISAIFNNDK